MPWDLERGQRNLTGLYCHLLSVPQKEQERYDLHEDSLSWDNPSGGWCLVTGLWPASWASWKLQFPPFFCLWNGQLSQLSCRSIQPLSRMLNGNMCLFTPTGGDRESWSSCSSMSKLKSNASLNFFELQVTAASEMSALPSNKNPSWDSFADIVGGEENQQEQRK